jgi:hypothetical protein
LKRRGEKRYSFLKINRIKIKSFPFFPRIEKEEPFPSFSQLVLSNFPTFPNPLK